MVILLGFVFRFSISSKPWHPEKLIQMLFLSENVRSECCFRIGPNRFKLFVMEVEPHPKKKKTSVLVSCSSSPFTGKVTVDGRVVNKCGTPISDKSIVEIKAEVPKFVCR